MTNSQYERFVKDRAPRSPLGKDMLKAFLTGGVICCIGQVFQNAYLALGLDETVAGTAVSITMVFIGAMLTGLGLYDTLARHGGGGTLVPITGFANSVAAPALEFKSEGFVTGTAVKMFSIAGPVIVFGTLASVIYGIWLYVQTLI